MIWDIDKLHLYICPDAGFICRIESLRLLADEVVGLDLRYALYVLHDLIYELSVAVNLRRRCLLAGILHHRIYHKEYGNSHE